jgi:eukaryotic-like serine/threonine-protein kinase
MASSIDLVGSTLGSYRIQKLIGQGAMGWVYQAYHTELERVVAIKVLKADSTNQNQKALSLFKKEAQIASKIRHPNVITIYDFGIYHSMFKFFYNLLILLVFFGSTFLDLTR